MKASEVTITRAWLLKRCEVHGGHWVWQKSCGGGGPRGHVKTEDKKQAQFSVRHVAFRLWHGRDVAPGMIAYPSCGDPLCVGRCLEERRPGGWNAGKPRSALTRMKIAQTQRARMGMDQAKVQAVRNSPDVSLRQLAAETGMSPKVVHDLRVGRRRVDYGGAMGSIVATLGRR